MYTSLADSESLYNERDDTIDPSLQAGPVLIRVIDPKCDLVRPRFFPLTPNHNHWYTWYVCVGLQSDYAE